MRTNSMFLALGVTATLALGGAACAHHAPPPARSPATPWAATARANTPVTVSIHGTPLACAKGDCEAYQRLIATLAHTVLHFDYNSALLKPEATTQLAAVAAAMQAVPDVAVRIAGNCDERGTDEYNLALGQERADAARTYLVALGIPGSRIVTTSYGKEHPLDLGHDEAAWAKNRRDELVPTAHQ